MNFRNLHDKVCKNKIFYVTYFKKCLKIVVCKKIALTY